MRTFIVGAACSVIATACASLPASKRPCAVGEDVIVSNQSVEWIRVYTHASNGMTKMLGSLAPGEEATYSLDTRDRLRVMALERPYEPNGSTRTPRGIFFSCLEPVD